MILAFGLIAQFLVSWSFAEFTPNSATNCHLMFKMSPDIQYRPPQGVPTGRKISIADHIRVFLREHPDMLFSKEFLYRRFWSSDENLPEGFGDRVRATISKVIGGLSGDDRGKIQLIPNLGYAWVSDESRRPQPTRPATKAKRLSEYLKANPNRIISHRQLYFVGWDIDLLPTQIDKKIMEVIRAAIFSAQSFDGVREHLKNVTNLGYVWMEQNTVEGESDPGSSGFSISRAVNTIQENLTAEYSYQELLMAGWSYNGRDPRKSQTGAELESLFADGRLVFRPSRNGLYRAAVRVGPSQVFMPEKNYSPLERFTAFLQTNGDKIFDCRPVFEAVYGYDPYELEMIDCARSVGSLMAEVQVEYTNRIRLYVQVFPGARFGWINPSHQTNGHGIVSTGLNRLAEALKSQAGRPMSHLEMYRIAWRAEAQESPSSYFWSNLRTYLEERYRPFVRAVPGGWVWLQKNEIPAVRAIEFLKQIPNRSIAIEYLFAKFWPTAADAYTATDIRARAIRDLRDYQESLGEALARDLEITSSHAMWSGSELKESYSTRAQRTASARLYEFLQKEPNTFFDYDSVYRGMYGVTDDELYDGRDTKNAVHNAYLELRRSFSEDTDKGEIIWAQSKVGLFVGDRGLHFYRPHFGFNAATGELIYRGHHHRLPQRESLALGYLLKNSNGSVSPTRLYNFVNRNSVQQYGDDESLADPKKAADFLRRLDNRLKSIYFRFEGIVAAELDNGTDELRYRWNWDKI